MSLTRLIKTSSFRLTLLYVALFGVSVLLLCAVIYWATVSQLAEQLDAQIMDEVAELQTDYTTTGGAHLVTEVTTRIRAPSKGVFYYLLQDATGKVIIGDLPATPAVTGWTYLANPASSVSSAGEEKDAGDDEKLRAYGVKLEDGRFVLVAQATHRLEDMADLVLDAFSWALAVTVLLALVGGVVMSRGLLRRVDSINATARQIMAGDLSRRIAAQGTADEFDQLAVNLNQMLERIESLMEGVRQVSNDIAHDLRTPLSRLRQRLESTRVKANSLADYEVAVEQAIADTDAILDTFGALLRIAQIEAGTRRAGFTGVDLSAVFNAIVEAYAPVAEDQGQRLVGAVTPGIQVWGDRDLLTQMLANLVENALCHTPAGTQIEVTLQGGSGGPVAVVADTGPGIPQAVRQKVFQRFYRLDASRNTAGSGLGLSLVAAIAELHSIAIELADNTPGLRVALTFPTDRPVGVG